MFRRTPFFPPSKTFKDGVIRHQVTGSKLIFPANMVPVPKATTLLDTRGWKDLCPENTQGCTQHRATPYEKKGWHPITLSYLWKKCKKSWMVYSKSWLSCLSWSRNLTNMNHLHPSQSLCCNSEAQSTSGSLRSTLQKQPWITQTQGCWICQPLSSSHCFKACNGLPRLASHSNWKWCFK